MKPTKEMLVRNKLIEDIEVVARSLNKERKAGNNTTEHEKILKDLVSNL